MTLVSSGAGQEEVLTVTEVRSVQGLPLATARPGDVVVRVDPRYFRPTEVETLLGDASKARAKLGWAPTTQFNVLVRDMVLSDHDQARRDGIVQQAGFRTLERHE